MVTMTKTRVAEALFVSDLQPSQPLSTPLIEAAVDRMIERYGADGCAARMASEFGDHPDLAVNRMIWVHRILGATGVA